MREFSCLCLCLGDQKPIGQPETSCPTNPNPAAPTPHSTAASTSISQRRMTASSMSLSLSKPKPASWFGWPAQPSWGCFVPAVGSTCQPPQHGGRNFSVSALSTVLAVLPPCQPACNRPSQIQKINQVKQPKTNQPAAESSYCVYLAISPH